MSLRWKRYANDENSDDETNDELKVLRQHWKNLLHIFRKSLVDQEDIKCVIAHFQNAVGLLVDEVSVQTRPGPVFLYFVAESLLETFFIWSLSCPEYALELKYYQLRCYESLLSRSRHELLFHKQIFKPLLNLLRSCESSSTSLGFINKHMIVVLNQICVSITKNPNLLEFCFDISSQHGPSRFIIFSLLIPFVHRDGHTGQQARDALLLIMQLSHRNHTIARYIVDQTNFCPILATGLSGLYSELPHRLPNANDEWFKISKDEYVQNTSLVQFMNSLQFCDDIIQIAHSSIGHHLLQYIYHGFLIPVLGPSIYQNNMDEVIAATAYLDLFIRTIHEAALLKVFLRFILCAKIDEISLIDTLIQRLSLPNKLGLVSLELFYTLINLNCEDVMYRLIFIYLIPCRHVMSSQRRYIKEMEIYGKNGERFLALKPLFENENNSSENWSNPLERYSCTFSAYLQDAHYNIKRCRRACHCWSAPYDGENPSSDTILEKFDLVSMSSSETSFNGEISPSVSFPAIVNNLSLAQTVARSNDSGIHEEGLELNPTIKSNNEKFELPTWLVQNEPIPDELLAKYSTRNRRESFQEDQKRNHSFYSFSFIDWPEKSSNDIWSTNSSIDELDKSPTCFQEQIQQCVERLEDCLTEFREINEPNELEKFDETFDEDFQFDLDLVEEFWLKSSTFDEFLNFLDRIVPRKVSKNAKIVVEQFLETIEHFEEERRNFSTMKTDFDSTNSMETSFFIGNELTQSTMIQSFSQQNSNSSTSNGKNGDVGPFLRIIFDRLEHFLQNSTTFNLLLTGIVTRLGQYSQPLLRSFLLNQSLVLETDIKSLYQILLNLKSKFETNSKTFSDFSRLIRFGHVKFHEREQIERPKSANQNEKLVAETSSKRNRFWNFFRTKKSQDETEENSQIFMLNRDSIRFVQREETTFDEEWDDPKTRHLACSAVIFNEFVKELAALAFEHNVQQTEDDDFIDDSIIFSSFL